MLEISVTRKIGAPTNEYFAGKERIVEEYLDVYEPKWPDCVNMLCVAGFDFETKYNMAGYIAYLSACTPTAARIAHITTEEVAQLVIGDNLNCRLATVC